MGFSDSFCTGPGTCSGPENGRIMQNRADGQPIQVAGTLIQSGTTQTWQPRTTQG